MTANLKRIALNNHGYCSFDYNQTNHSMYPNLVAQHGAPQARPGLCGALTIMWLQGYRLPGTVKRVFQTHAESPVGLNQVTNYVNTITVAGVQWQNQADNIMAGLNFVPGARTQINENLQQVLSTSPYAILLAYGAAASHAMGVRVLGRSIYFFDSNSGEAFFASIADFCAWFHGMLGFAATYLPGVVGPNYHLMHLAYT